MLVFLHLDLSMSLEQEIDYLPFDIDLTALQAALIESDTAGPLPPEIFSNGLFFSDPLQPIALSMEDPTPLLDPLEENGHSATSTIGGAAVGPPQPIDECLAGIQNLVQWITAGTESHILQPGSFLNGYQTARNDDGCSSCTETPILITETSWELSCSSWQPIRVFSTSDCTAKTEFSRTLTNQRTRLKTKVCEDCTVFQCESSQTRTSTQKGTGLNFDMGPSCNVELIDDPFAGGVPDRPCNESFSVRLGFTGTTGQWQPPCFDSQLACP